ncbi:MAG: hypothetical protein WC750_02770 [Patescibacteria group bacterium]|jgi:hypothetical protein
MHVGKRVGVTLFTIILYLLLQALFEWLGLSSLPSNLLAGGTALLSTSLLLFMPFALKRSRLLISKRKRHRTYGREFLLLLDKDVRHQCRLHWKRQSKYYRYWFYTAVAANSFALFRMTFDLRDPSTSKPLGVLVFLIALLLIFCSLLFLLTCDVLLPIYRQRRQAKAQAERDAVTQRIEAKLPQARYRVSGSTITSIEQFRSMASESRLPEEFILDAKDLERANLELMEAEADMPAQPQTKAQTT